MVGSIEAGMRIVFMAASTSFRPWPVMSNTICSLRPSSSDPRSFFNAATVAAAAGSANTPVFSARNLCPLRISWSVTVSESHRLSSTAFRAMCALEGMETEIESAMVSGRLAFWYFPLRI